MNVTNERREENNNNNEKKKNQTKITQVQPQVYTTHQNHLGLFSIVG